MLRFAEGPAQLTALPPIYCPTWDLYIGPQYGDADLMSARSRLVWFDHDPCDAGAVAQLAARINGRAVLLSNPNGMCAPSHIYDLFQGANASALATIDDSPVPTYGGLLPDDIHGKIRYPGTMLFVRFHLDSDTAALLIRTVSDESAPGVVVDLRPDYNVWLDMVGAWWYIVPVCVLPALYYGACAILASMYLHIHLVHIISSVSEGAPRSRGRSSSSRSVRETVRHVWSQCGIPQTALLIESTTTLLLCANSASGFGGIANSTYLGISLMQSQLSGLSCSSTLLSAIFWRRCRNTLLTLGKRAATPFDGFAEQHKTLATALLWTLVALPTVADVILGALVGYRIAQQFFLSAYTLLLMIIYAVIAIYFFQQARSFRGEVCDVVKGIDADMLAFVVRISRWTTRAGLFMVFTVCVLSVGATIWIWTPVGWSAFWALCGIGRAGISFCHIQEFRPRSRTKPVTTCGHPPASIPLGTR
ncbi:Receptor ligand binding region domain-containing protein [Plasmodiophora brassicae]